MLEEVLNFVTVLAVAVGVASVIGSLYAFGLRFWSAGEAATQGGDSRGRSITMRTVGAVFFAACVFVVLFALWLMIPIFH